MSPWSFLDLNPQRQGGELNRKTGKVIHIELWGRDVFQNGVKLSKEEDAGRDEGLARAFRELKMIDPRKKKN